MCNLLYVSWWGNAFVYIWEFALITVKLQRITPKPDPSIPFLKLWTALKSCYPSQVPTGCLHQLCVPVLLSVPCLCLNTVCHLCAHVRLRIFMCLRARLSTSTTWLSLPSRFRKSGWQGWGKHIIKKNVVVPLRVKLAQHLHMVCHQPVSQVYPDATYNCSCFLLFPLK